nr:xylulose kinase-1 [Tanacetum cinerariifolium]
MPWEEGVFKSVTDGLKTFADSHNMITYLTKSDASEGFNQIIDFLNTSLIKYALTINPNIYVSCIKQFWTSVLVKKVNDVTRLQALVDKKRVIITEATIRDALRLADAEEVLSSGFSGLGKACDVAGVEWQEKMLQCYSSMNSGKEVKVLWSWQVGKGCSGVETPLFEGMLVAQQVDESTSKLNDDDVPAAGAVEVHIDVVPAAVDEPSTTSPLPPLNHHHHHKIYLPLPKITMLKQRVKKLERKNKPKVSKIRKLKKVGTAQRTETSDDTVMDDVSKQGRIIADMDANKDVTLKDVDVVAIDVQDAKIEESSNVYGRQAESQAQIYQIDLKHADKVLSMHDVDIKPVEHQEVVEVVTTAKLITEVVTAASATITVATPQLTTIATPTLTTAPSAARRRKGVVIRDPEETDTPSTIIHSEAKSKDKGKGILKTKEQMEEEDSRALKRISESQEDKAAKKQKLDKEVEELRKHLQIVLNDEDDVYTEATPLARKVPIVDYEIYTKNNKPYYKIIRADGLQGKHAKCLRLLVKDLMLPSQIDVVG